MALSPPENLISGLSLPNVPHGLPKVFVGLVKSSLNIECFPVALSKCPHLHLDVEGGSDKGKECRLELDRSIVVEWHVHGYQSLWEK